MRLPNLTNCRCIKDPSEANMDRLRAYLGLDHGIERYEHYMAQMGCELHPQDCGIVSGMYTIDSFRNIIVPHP